MSGPTKIVRLITEGVSTPRRLANFLRPAVGEASGLLSFSATLINNQWFVVRINRLV
jgi:hypothetical protein